MKVHTSSNRTLGLVTVLTAGLLIPVAGTHASSTMRIVPQTGHTAFVVSTQFSNDGKRLVSASGDNTAKVWDAESGRELKSFVGHSSYLMSAQFSSDDRLIVTSSNDRTAKIWNARTGESLQTLTGHTDWVKDAVFSPDSKLVLTVSGDRTARIWNSSTGTTLHILRGHTNEVNSGVFTSDGSAVLTASSDGTARLWNADTGESLGVISVGPSKVTCATLSTGSSQIATGSEDGSLAIWNVASGERINLKGHEGNVSGLDFSPDGTKIVSSSWDGSAIVWDAKTGRLLQVLKGHADQVRSAQFSPDGNMVVTSSLDRTSRIWDVKDGRLLKILNGSSASVTSIAHSSASRQFAIAAGNQATIIDAQTSNTSNILNEHSDQILCVSFSQTGNFLLTSSADGTAKISSLLSGKVHRVLKGHAGAVVWGDFSPDQTKILTTSSDGTAKIWDSESGKLVLNLSQHSGLVSSGHFSRDSRRVVTSGYDAKAIVWDTISGKPVLELVGHSAMISSAIFSPDGGRILTTSFDNTARIWDAGTGKVLVTLRGHNGWVSEGRFSKDGSKVFTFSWDQTAMSWDATTGKLLVKFSGHTAPLSGGTLDADESHLLTCSTDGTLNSWSTQSGKLLFTRYSFIDGSWIILAPDGRYDSSEGPNPKFGHFVIDLPTGPEAIGFDQFNPTEFYYKDLAKAITEGTYKPGDRSIVSEKAYPAVTQELSDSDLKFTVTDQGGGIGDVDISINGTKRFSYPAGKIKSGQPTTLNLLPLGYIPGQEITIVAWNAANGLSTRSASVRPQRSQSQTDTTPKRFIAVLIGSEGYSGSGSFDRLDFSGNDVVELGLVLHAMALSAGAQPEITVITDEPQASQRLSGLKGITLVSNTTKKSWSQVVDRYKQSDFTPNDWFVLVLSGHGVSVNNQYAYMTVESTTSAPAPGSESLFFDRAITADELQQLMSRAGASNQIIILDTCAAGSASEALADAMRQDKVSIEATVAKLSYGNRGVHILLGSAADAAAFESPELGHGLLTYSLLSVLQQGLDLGTGAESRVIMSAKWLSEASKLCREVAERRSKAQVPRPMLGSDFALGSLTDAQRIAIPVAKMRPGIYRSALIDETSADVAWLNEGILNSLEANPRGAAFARSDSPRGTEVFEIVGIVKAEGDQFSVTLRLVQETPQGRRRASPPKTIRVTREGAAGAVLKAAEELLTTRESWPP